MREKDFEFLRVIFFSFVGEEKKGRGRKEGKRKRIHSRLVYSAMLKLITIEAVSPPQILPAK